MPNSERISQAVIFASNVHEGVLRKGKEVPYITHPLTVSLILSRVSKDINVVIAGILHDTIEDCEPYGSVTYDILLNLFGIQVANMVNDVTEQDKTLPWDERKQLALDHISQMNHDSLLVKTADVLHNMTELIFDIEKDGGKVFEKFNTQKKKTMTRYAKLLAALKKAWPENPLLIELEEQYNKLIKLV